MHVCGMHPAMRLQWGRNLSVAEGGCQLRKQARLHRTLQWGRNLSVAEGPNRVPKFCKPAKASMGPQPFGCGRVHGAPRT